MFEGMNYIYEVYKEKSFSKAAANLYISQPSLSATVKKIEERIGAPIFDRSTNPIQLTIYGREYIRHVEKVMDLENSFENYMHNLNELKTGKIAVGGSSFFTSFLLPPIVTEFSRRYPLVKVNLTEGDTASLEKKLFSGSLDLILDNCAVNEKIYEKVIFCEEHLLLAVPKAFASNEAAAPFRLTRKDIVSGRHLKPSCKGVSLKLFAEDPFIFLRNTNDTRKRGEKICQNHQISPHVILKLDQQITAYNLACHGMGITFISDNLIAKTNPDKNIVYYKLADPEAARSVHFYYKQNKYLTRAVEEFLKVAQEISVSQAF